MKGRGGAAFQARAPQVEASLDSDQAGVHARQPAAHDRDRLGRRSGEVHALLEPAVLKPEGMSDLRAGQGEVPGYPRPGEPQTRDGARLRGVRALKERHGHGGPNRPPGTPLPAPGDTVLLGHTRAQVRPGSLGKRVPQLTLRWGQLAVREHQFRVVIFLRARLTAWGTGRRVLTAPTTERRPGRGDTALSSTPTTGAIAHLRPPPPRRPAPTSSAARRTDPRPPARTTVYRCARPDSRAASSPWCRRRRTGPGPAAGGSPRRPTAAGTAAER